MFALLCRNAIEFGLFAMFELFGEFASFRSCDFNSDFEICGRVFGAQEMSASSATSLELGSS